MPIFNRHLLAAILAAENMGFYLEKYNNYLDKSSNDEKQIVTKLLASYIESDDMQLSIEEEASYWYNKIKDTSEELLRMNFSQYVKIMEQ